jgi:hypothetical protein
MRIGSLTEAAAKLGMSRPQLERLVSQGKLHIFRGEHPKAPVFVTDEALKAAGFEPPDEFGEISAETVITEAVEAFLSEMWQRIEVQDRVIEELKAQVQALTALHSYRGGTAHCLPPLQDLATRWPKLS